MGERYGAGRMVVTVAAGVRPIVGVSCCARMISDAPFHTVLDRYVDALDRFANCTALLIPARGDRLRPEDHDTLLDRLDGVLLTGGRSMVGPEFYGGPDGSPTTLRDPLRDRTSIPLARRAVEMAVPLFGICRGLQELCCAFGGALEPDLLARDPSIDHRARADRSYEDKYRPTHDVQWHSDGHIAQMLAARGVPSRTPVNSLHVQGIDRLASCMTIEATADDGLIEAASICDAANLAFGVQWHPEWHVEENPVSAVLFEVFGTACRARAEMRAGFLRDGVGRAIETPFARELEAQR